MGRFIRSCRNGYTRVRSCIQRWKTKSDLAAIDQNEESSQEAARELAAFSKEPARRGRRSLIGSNVIFVLLIGVTMGLAIEGASPLKYARVEPFGIHLQTASHAQLCLLPTIGDKTATRIIEFREKHPITSREDLALIIGMSDAKIRQMLPLTVWEVQ